MIIPMKLAQKRETPYKDKPQVKLLFIASNYSRVCLYLTPEEAEFHFGHVRVGQEVDITVGGV